MEFGIRNRILRQTLKIWSLWKHFSRNIIIGLKLKDSEGFDSLNLILNDNSTANFFLVQKGKKR